MYVPKVFSVRDADVVHRFVRANAFGTLIVARGDASAPHDGPEIAHLPFLLDAPEPAAPSSERPSATLRVHVARANPMWKLASSAARCTVVFAGPHTYVSPTWYGSPHEHVPTWNYAVVHAHCGPATVLDEASLEAMLADLSARYEDPETGWRQSDVDASFRKELMQQIVGLAFPITRLEAKFKLSQNREPADRQRVIEQLERRGLPDDLAMLEWMKAGG